VSGAAAPALPEMLGRLKLTAMRDRLDVLLDEAVRRGLNLPEVLGLLCEAEVAHREERRIQMGLSVAKFPYMRTLEGFDFAAQPSLDPKQVRELAACRWVANGDTVLIQGPPGVGKSHIAVALGREAVRQGYSVLFTPAMALMTDLVKAQAEGRLEEKLTRYAKPKLLILDEFGYLPLEPHAAHLFFALPARTLPLPPCARWLRRHRRGLLPGVERPHARAPAVALRLPLDSEGRFIGAAV